VALWREALLAQKVLANQTKGYKNHPQLIRFKQAPKPLEAMGYYLTIVQQQATERGYNFDATKIVNSPINSPPTINVTSAQLQYEYEHLRAKVKIRAPQLELKECENIIPHPLFTKVNGKVEHWERIA